METKDLKQVIIFDATASEIYEALLDEAKHSLFTGAEAIIDREIDGKFSVYDEYCYGYNIELIPNKKIVQAWHFVEDNWPDDHYSICTFLLKQNGDKTVLTFTQTGIPEHKLAALTKGWEDYYWQPLKEFLKI